MLKYLFAKEDDIPQGSCALFFAVSSIAWFIIGTGLGSFNAAKLAFPDWYHGLYALQFGHMRQVHVHAVIFGWIAMAFAASMMYITPALGNTKLWSEKLGLWNCLLYNIGLCLALALLWSGMTSGREYSDHIWPIDLYIAFVMVVPWSVNVWMTILNRRTQGIYTTNWFFAGSMFMLIIVFLVGNLPEFFHLTGLNEAYMTWWFAHHLMSSPLPEWLKSFASVEGVLILVPAVAYVSNILLTMQGKWSMFVENIELKFTLTGVLLAIPLNMQGGFQQTRAINWYIHGTGWIVAHAHLALLGFSTFAEAAAVYYGIQVLLRRKLYSSSLANFHFWMLLIGFSLYWTSMTIAGLIQGAAKIYEVPYVDVVIAEHPYMIVRWLGGTMVFFGNIIWLFNMVMTARAGEVVPVGRQPAEIAYTR